MKDFESVVEKVIERLYTVYRETPEQITACRSGDAFENIVYEATLNVVESNNIEAEVLYTPGSHAFPDIIVSYSDGDKYGIEVKCSSSSTSNTWKINGNSVLGSTRESVIDNYIVFGKTKSGNVGFRYKRYEDAIANVVVTHSPRYFIDLDISEDDSFFAKSGLTYQQINTSDNPIGLITNYFRREGQRAWWLGETSPAALKLFHDIESREQSEIIGYCFSHFPEVFSNGTKKFARCAMWMVTDRSVVAPSLRDSFTAGGRANIETENNVYTNQPRIIINLQNYKNEVIRQLQSEESEKLYGSWYDTDETTSPIINTLNSFENRIDHWATLSARYYNQTIQNGNIEEIKEMLLDILQN